MAGSQDYGLNFLIKQYGQENLLGITSAIGDAARRAKEAKEQSQLWGEAIKKAADLAGVSVKGVNDQIRQQSKDLDEARRATERLAAEEKKRYEDGLRFLRNREANEARDAANRLARQRAEDSAFRSAFGGSGGGDGGSGSGGGGSSLFGRVGGRVLGAEVLGRGLGIPGGGFIGSQLAYGSGLSGGAALGLGAAAVGVVGAYALTKLIEDTTKYAQEQLNLARATGLTVQQTQALGRVSEITGTQANGLFTVLRKMNDSLIGGGAAARNVETGLKELGLTMDTAFKAPEAQLRDLFGALQKITSIAERGRIIDQIFGSGAKDTLLAQVDKFERLYEITKKGVIDEKSLKQLEDFKEKASIAGLEWDKLKETLAVKAVGFIELIFSTGGKLDLSPRNVADKVGTFLQGPIGMYNRAVYEGARAIPGAIGGLFGNAVNNAFVQGAGGADTGPGPYVPKGPATPQDVKDASRVDERSRIYRMLQSSGGDEVERIQSTISNLDTDIKAAREKALGESGTLGDAQKVQGLEAQRVGLRRQLQIQQQIKSELLSLSEFGGISTEAEGVEAARALTRRGAFRAIKESGTAGQRQTLLGLTTQAIGTGYPTLSGGSPYFDPLSRIGELRGGSLNDLAEYYKDLADKERREKREADEAIRGIDVTQTGSDKEARGAQLSGIASIRLSQARGDAFSKYGLRPLDISRRQAEAALSANQQEGGVQEAFINAQIKSRQAALYSLGRVGGDDEKVGLETEKKRAEIEELQLELSGKQNDRLTKSVDIIAKFNDAVDKSAEAIRSEFASGFESIILGAQRGGGKGLKGALRGFGEQQEGIILRNIGEKVFDQIKGPLGSVGGSLPKSVQDILKGTILQAPVDKIKDNTDQIKTDISAIRQEIEKASGGAGGTSTGTGGTGTGSSSPLGNILGTLGSLKGVGVFGGSDAGGLIFHNQDPGGGGGSGIGGGTSSGSIGKIAGAVAGGILAAHGISDLTRPGAKSKIGGIGEIAGGGGAALTALGIGGLAGPIGIAAGALFGIVSSFLGDSRESRGAQISKNLFGQQYLAPQAITLNEYGGGYSDFGIDGSVRTSNFSPYPTVSNSFLDVPRRTVVPGHTISSFGGTDAGTPGAIVTPSSPRVAGNAGAPSYHITIQALDHQSFLDNADKIVDAFHRGLNNQGHPVVNALAQAMGVRG